MTDYDVEALRAEFPALALEQHGRPAAYFDGPGGTQVSQRVIDAVTRYYLTSNANDGGAFLTSERSDAVVAEARGAGGRPPRPPPPPPPQPRHPHNTPA